MTDRIMKLENYTDTFRQDLKSLKEGVTLLQEDTGQVKVDVAVIKSNYVLREDLLRLDGKFDIRLENLRTELHRSLASQTKWLAASQLGLLGVGLCLAKLLF